MREIFVSTGKPRMPVRGMPIGCWQVGHGMEPMRREAGWAAACSVSCRDWRHLRQKECRQGRTRGSLKYWLHSRHVRRALARDRLGSGRFFKSSISGMKDEGGSETYGGGGSRLDALVGWCNSCANECPGQNKHLSQFFNLNLSHTDIYLVK